jgi:hypothetical protein
MSKGAADKGSGANGGGHRVIWHGGSAKRDEEMKNEYRHRSAAWRRGK